MQLILSLAKVLLITSTLAQSLPSNSTPSTSNSEDSNWISSSFGLMIEDSSSIKFNSLDLHERNSASTTQSNAGDIQTRDIAKRNMIMKVDENGELIWDVSAASDEEAEANPIRLSGRSKYSKKHNRKSSTSSSNKKSSKHASINKSSRSKPSNIISKSSKKYASTSIKDVGVKLASVSNSAFQAVITWYSGEGLRNPYCAQSSKWTPTDNSMIAAVTQDWADKPPCGSFLQLKTPGSPTTIVVRVVDLCGGCQAGVAHIDLSQAAFKKLYALNVGEVHGIQVSRLSGNPDENWDEGLYGPESL